MVQALQKIFVAGVITIFGIYLLGLLSGYYQSFFQTLNVIKSTFDLQFRENEIILRRFERAFNVTNLSKEQEGNIKRIIENTRIDVVKMMLEISPRTKRNIKKTLKERTYINNMLQSILSSQKHVLLDHIEIRNSSRTYDLVVLVMSNTPNFHRRKAIRAVWGNKTKTASKNWCLIFVTGGVPNRDVMRRLYMESRHEKDIIVVDSLENYENNLPRKDMSGFTWANANLKFRHLLKSDDDLFINIDGLLALLATKGHIKLLYLGQYWSEGAEVQRTGKFGVSKEDHLNDTYPPYCSGGAYVLSQKLIEKIIPHFDWVSPLRIEDAYIGLKVQEAGGQGVHSDKFFMFNTKCSYVRGLIASHPADAACMEKLMKKSLDRNSSFKSLVNTSLESYVKSTVKLALKASEKTSIKRLRAPVKPTVKPLVRATEKPSIENSEKLSENPSMNYLINPFTKLKVKRPVNPVVKLLIKPSRKPSAKPSVKAVIKLSEKPSKKSSIKPPVKPSIKPPIEPTKKASVKSTIKPSINR